jgi:hypothetical protein
MEDAERFRLLGKYTANRVEQPATAMLESNRCRRDDSEG